MLLIQACLAVSYLLFARTAFGGLATKDTALTGISVAGMMATGILLGCSAA